MQKSVCRYMKKGLSIKNTHRESISQSLMVSTLVSAALILAGCTVGPKYQQPEMSIPATWGTVRAQPASTPALSHWWEGMNDPVLNALIDKAIKGNLDVATAKAKIREARANYDQAGGALVPTLTGSASATRSGSGTSTTSSSSGTSVSTGSAGNTFKAGFDASWELDLFGANKKSVEAAKYGMDAAGWSLRSTLLTLIGDVTSNYVQARGYQARMGLARTTAVSQEETAKIMRIKYSAGALSGLNAVNSEAQAKTTLAAVPTLQTSFTQTVHNLSVLTGEPPESLIAQMVETAPVPTPKLPVAMGVPANILLSRPDVRMAEKQYAQYTAKVGQAEAARYPAVSLTGALNTSGTQFGDLARHSTLGWSFGPSLTLPLFNGGKLKAAVEVARAQQDQYFIAYQSAVLAALKDVENASVALSQETVRVVELEASVESYRKAATLTHLLYKAGSVAFLDVLTADRSLYTAQDSLIQSQVLIATYYISLNKALGGGWDGKINTDK